MALRKGSLPVRLSCQKFILVPLQMSHLVPSFTYELSLDYENLVTWPLTKTVGSWALSGANFWLISLSNLDLVVHVSGYFGLTLLGLI